jgi:hypothetical protein
MRPEFGTEDVLIIAVRQVGRQILDTEGEVRQLNLLHFEFLDILFLPPAHNDKHDERTQARAQIEKDNIKA